MAESPQSKNHNPKAFFPLPVQPIGRDEEYFTRDGDDYIPEDGNTFDGTDFAHSVQRLPGSTGHDPQQPPRLAPISTFAEFQGDENTFYGDENTFYGTACVQRP